MNYTTFAFTICVLFAANTVFGQSTDGSPHDYDDQLIGFVQIGLFCDRGIAAVGTLKPGESHENKAEQPEFRLTLPDRMRDLLMRRENNEVKAISKSLVIDLFPASDRDDSPECALRGFYKYGLVELLLNENTKLLDSSLTNRKAFKVRFKEIDSQVATVLSASYAKDNSTAKAIIIAGQLRRLTVDLELAIVDALTLDERARVGEVASYLLPKVISDANKANQSHVLGSSIVQEALRNGYQTK